MLYLVVSTVLLLSVQPDAVSAMGGASRLRRQVNPIPSRSPAHTHGNTPVRLIATSRSLMAPTTASWVNMPNSFLRVDVSRVRGENS